MFKILCVDGCKLRHFGHGIQKKISFLSLVEGYEGQFKTYVWMVANCVIFVMESGKN